MTDIEAAVLYALKSGCFFPVPEPKPTDSVRTWIQWGAMRNLHDVIAESNLSLRQGGS